MDRVRNRFYGKYRGVVTDVDASHHAHQGLSAVGAAADRRPDGACHAFPTPVRRSAFVMLPEVGSGVWIEFEGGDVSYPIWVGMYWRSGEMPSAASADGEEHHHHRQARSRSTTTRGSITLTDAQQNTVVLDSSGVTSTSGSSNVAIGASGVNVNNGALEVMLMPALLTAASTMMCPHGGTVMPSPGSRRPPRLRRSCACPTPSSSPDAPS